jgi:glutaredoxin
MTGYFIKAIMLENCPYSINADKIIKQYNLPHKILWIDNNSKNKYVNNMIQTFPQIYLKKNNSNQHLLLGGHDDLLAFISTFKSQKINDIEINNFMKKYNWSKKATLRLIQLIN